METYDEYGFSSADIDSCRMATEQALGLKFDQHHSSYRGTYFRCDTLTGETFLIQHNFVDENDEGWTLEERKDLGVLLFASNLANADSVCTQLLREAAGVYLLYRTIFDDSGKSTRYKVY